MIETTPINTAHPVNNVFQNDWYLDAVVPNNWARVEVRSRDELLGWMPYSFIGRYPGIRMIQMPPLIQTLGPWIKDTGGKTTRRLSNDKAIMTELINKLPKFDYFCQNFDYSITNWLPFYWQGFKQTTRYTYILKDISDQDRVFDGFASKLRSQIRKAQKSLEVCDDLGVDTLIKLNRMTYERQNISLPFTNATLRRLVTAAQKHDSGKMLFAVDSDENVHAAVFLVWDERSTYYLVGCTNTQFKGTDAGSLLLWESIKLASAKSRQFDFEGSMIESVERHFRSFGAVQVPYHQITKTNSLLLKTKDFIRGLIK